MKEECYRRAQALLPLAVTSALSANLFVDNPSQRRIEARSIEGRAAPRLSRGADGFPQPYSQCGRDLPRTDGVPTMITVAKPSGIQKTGKFLVPQQWHRGHVLNGRMQRSNPLELQRESGQQKTSDDDDYSDDAYQYRELVNHLRDFCHYHDPKYLAGEYFHKLSHALAGGVDHAALCVQSKSDT